MAGIEDLKLWRTEPFLSTFQEFSPEKKYLDWKYPLQGRWFAPDIDYPRRYLGTDTIIKELDTKFPFKFSDPTTHKIPITGNNFITHGSKTAAQLAAEQQLLKDWFPMYMSQADIVDNLHEDFDDWRKEFYKKRGNNTQPLTEAEYDEIKQKAKNYTTKMTDWEKDALYKMKTGKNIPFNEITPPQNIANKAKINLYESFLQNFRKPEVDHLNSLANKNIYTPKSRWENISRIPIKAKDIYNRFKMGEQIKSGIPWSTIGQRIINNPVTRFVGGAGNVVLGGQALSDVYAGTNTIGNMATTINKWAGVPFKDDGTVQTNIKDYRASLSKPKYGMPPKGAAGFNSGGIASLVV
tara:strand:- start:162 stop:1217 length:1056 start_codon:yes stop_codon:yes gene_type:complete